MEIKGFDFRLVSVPYMCNDVLRVVESYCCRSEILCLAGVLNDPEALEKYCVALLDKSEWQVLSRMIDFSADQIDMFSIHLDWHIMAARAEEEPVLLDNICAAGIMLDPDGEAGWYGKKMLMRYRDTANWNIIMRRKDIEWTEEDIISIAPFLQQAAWNSVLKSCPTIRIMAAVPPDIKVNWREICSCPGLAADFIEHYIHNLDLNILFTCQKMPNHLVKKYMRSIINGSSIVPKYQRLDRETILENASFLCFSNLLRFQTIDIPLLYELYKILDCDLRVYLEQIVENGTIRMATVVVDSRSYIILFEGAELAALFGNQGPRLCIDNLTGKTTML